MIREHAVLSVKPGQEVDFESSFAKAKSIIAGRPGFAGLTLWRGLEHPSTYLLLVDWGQLEDHTEGFRSSAQYQEWKRLLHHFYAPFPTVEHFTQVEQT